MEKNLEMNTIKYWLNKLPEHISKNAIANYEKKFPNGEEKEVNSIAEAVNWLQWKGSKEGMAYWRAVYTNAINGKEQNTIQ